MKVLLKTDFGDVELKLDKKNAPITAAYFAELISTGQLDATSFFRIVDTNSASSQSASPIEVLQCGNWLESHEELGSIKHESTQQTGLNHNKWSLSTARYAAGTVYGSFFICMRDEPVLDYGGSRHPDGMGFAVFGEVVSGFAVLEEIYNKRELIEFQKEPVKIITAVLLD